MAADDLIDSLVIPQEGMVVRKPTVVETTIVDSSEARYPTARSGPSGQIEREFWANAEQNPVEFWADVEKKYFSFDQGLKEALVKSVRENMLAAPFFDTPEKREAYLNRLPFRPRNALVQLFYPEGFNNHVANSFNEGGATYNELVLSVARHGGAPGSAGFEEYKQTWNDRFLNAIGTDFLTKVPESTQVEYLEKLMPGVVEQAELEEIKKAQLGQVYKWLLVSGIGFGALIIIPKFFKGKKAA